MPGEVGQRDVGVIGVRQARAKGQRAIAVAHVVELVGIERQGHEAHHHALIGLARVARQGQRVVGVVAVVDVGNGDVRLEDGGFEGHGLSKTRAASASQCLLWQL